MAFLKKLYEQSSYLLQPSMRRILRLLSISNKNLRSFSIECIALFLKSEQSELALKLTRVLHARLFDIDAKCRVAAIRACTMVMPSVADSCGYEWLATVFNEMTILMTDEKTSVRKEALVCLN
jgi:hypothetical protein